MALTKLTTDLIDGSLGTDWQTAIQTNNFTAEAGKGYFVNTTSAEITVTLPVGVVGMEITIQDYAGTFATNKVILAANGSEKIQGSASGGKITTNNATAVLIYQDATKGWTSQDATLNETTISWATPTGQDLTYTQPSPQSSTGVSGGAFPSTTFTATKAGNIISGTATISGLPSGITAAQTITGSSVGNTLTVTLTGTFPSTDYINTNLTLSGLTITVPPALTVDFLVVAGGGSGSGSHGGGGGAGGLRTSYGSGSGGGLSPETSLSLAESTNYTVTIGAGGTAPSLYNNGNSGSNSVFSTITSNGGGWGEYFNASGAGSGGSGGGASYGHSGGSGTVGQGYAGGNGGPAEHGGGGGGASQAGITSSSSAGGNGGSGLSVLITGSSVAYAGGGGGGINALGGGTTPGSGGTGGGGSATTGTGQSGTGNTGGGGAGGYYNGGHSKGGSGGSGIVVLRYPDYYDIAVGSGLTTGTLNTAVGTDEKYTTFTGGTGTITFGAA